MAKVIIDGKFPKRIDNLVLYKLDNQVIIREISGFTSVNLLTSPKYILSRQNASEFGRVSSTCKQLRLALKDYLPKKNNLLVVNTLTKKMRQNLIYDTISLRGERILLNAFANIEGRKLMNGYHFNPEANSLISFAINKNLLKVCCKSIVFPDEADSVGFLCLTLTFDFETYDSQLTEGTKQFYNKAALPDMIALKIPHLVGFKGNVFKILTVTFYTETQGSYVPVLDDSSKVVLVVG